MQKPGCQARPRQNCWKKAGCSIRSAATTTRLPPFVEGKRRARELSGQAYLAEHAAQLVNRLRGFFTASRLRIVPRAGVRSDSAQPMFILGFPRSGTTLVEQTLSVHPRIAAGDELPLVSEIAGIMPRMFDSPLAYPEALVELWMADHHEGLDNLRDHYLQKARQLGAVADDVPWFTDKMPLNETHLGLIALMFPEAPLIHVRAPSAGRGAVGVLQLSDARVLLRRRAGERGAALRADHGFGAPLPGRDESALFAGALRGRGRRPGDTVARMLAFVGEPFDERCLRFHENRRYARTASYAQVTEKLYDRSRFRYRNYLKHLEPVIPVLRPVIERLGYTVG